MTTNSGKFQMCEGVPRRSVLTLMLGGLVSACGGGATLVSGISSGGTGSFATGSIVGFGSVIVNGVRYDDVNAKVADLDGADHTNANALKLGMVVAVQGSATTATTAATAGFNYSAESVASRVVFLTELKGAISALDAGQNRFEILGQVVRWSTTTVFDGLSTQAANLANGQQADVYGLWDAQAQLWQATRVETSATVPSLYRLTGGVDAVDASQQTLSLSGQVVRVAGLTLDAAIGPGSRVRAVLDPNRASGAPWTAQSVRLADWSAVPTLDAGAFDDHDAELEGVVSGVSGTRFSLQGFTVDGSALGSMVSNGQRVEVKGRFAQGVLVAHSWESEDDEARAGKGFELHGVVSALTASNFVLRGFTVVYDSVTVGRSALANGAGVEARLRLRADGTWYAVEVEFDDDASASGSGNDDDGDDD